MKTFYSILYVPIRPSLDEKVSIALLLRDEEEVYFKYSKKKLGIIKDLMPSSAYSLLKSSLRNIETQVNKVKEERVNNILVQEKTKSSDYLSESYLSYLHQYSLNLLSFSKPQAIKLCANQNNFNSLFEKCIFELDTHEEEDNVLSAIKIVQENLFPKIKSRVNIQKQLTAKNIPNLVFPTEVNFIGRNDVPVAGHTFDFEKRRYNLEHDISLFDSLVKALELNNNNEGKFYIIGEEPKKREHPKNHLLWKEVYDSKVFDFVPVEEVSSIENYLNEHDVQPFFENENIG